jgi:histidinol-phosphate aminotransferase
MSYFRQSIEEMSGYTPGEQLGAEFLKLNTNENPYPPSPRVLDALRTAAGEGLRLYPHPLADSFRDTAARLLGVERDWILAGNGSDDLLTIMTRSFAGSGDVIVAPTPSYLLYQTLAKLQQARYVEVPFDAAWSLGDDMARPDAQLAFLPNPNSPSGTMIPPERVAELARRLPCPLVVDEAYVDFATTSCVGLVRDLPNVVVTRTLSKSYSLAGLRFGFAVARPELIRGMIKVKDSYNCDTLSIVGAVAALEDQPHLRANVARIVATRERLAAELRQFGFRVPDSKANFVWCTDGPRPAQALYQQLKARSILVRYLNYGPHGDGLRISVGSDEAIERLVGAMRDLLS